MITGQVFYSKIYYCLFNFAKLAWYSYLLDELFKDYEQEQKNAFVPPILIKNNLCCIT